MRYEKLNAPSTKGRKSRTAGDILDAAMELFTKHGFCSVTVRDIAAKAGVNPALIPYYYKSKDILGNSVYQQMAERLYKELAESMLEEASLGSAEKMYICTMQSLEYMLKIASKFYHEYMEYCHENYVPSRFIVRLSRNVIREYDLQITDAENDIYLTTLIAAERFLITRRNRGEISLSDEMMVNIMMSNYYFNINLPDQTIADIISRSKEFLQEH